MHVAYDPGSVFLWRLCDNLCTFGLVDDVMFSYYGANGPGARQVAIPVVRQTTTCTVFDRVYQNATPGNVCYLQLTCFIVVYR